MRVSLMLAPVFAAVSAAGCSSMQATPPPDFKFAVTVESDPGVAMPGAVISRAARVSGCRVPIEG